MNDVLERVVKLIADEFGVDAAMVTEASELDALGLDSLDRVELAMLVEDDFAPGRALDLEGAWKTVGDITAELAGMLS